MAEEAREELQGHMSVGQIVEAMQLVQIGQAEARTARDGQR